MVDFNVERHILVTREITQIFHQSYTGCNSKGGLIQDEGTTSEEV
jgi:hypothetical protein